MKKLSLSYDTFQNNYFTLDAVLESVLSLGHKRKSIATLARCLCGIMPVCTVNNSSALFITYLRK